MNVSQLWDIAKFNYQLASLLAIPDLPSKLKSIISLSTAYPQNKEVTRYHAAFVVQQQLSVELEEYI